MRNAALTLLASTVGLADAAASAQGTTSTTSTTTTTPQSRCRGDLVETIEGNSVICRRPTGEVVCIIPVNFPPATCPPTGPPFDNPQPPPTAPPPTSVIVTVGPDAAATPAPRVVRFTG